MSAALVILPVVWAYEACVTEVDERKGPVRLVVTPLEVQELAPAPVPEMAFYRKYTEAVVRRYVRLSMEAGRAPSLLGRELFRGKVTSYKVRSFDDVVIFVHDVGQCLEKLGSGHMHLIRRIAMQEYTQGETAGLTGLGLRTVTRQYGDALDKLTGMFLRRGLLQPKIACQEGKNGSFPISDWND